MESQNHLHSPAASVRNYVKDWRKVPGPQLAHRHVSWVKLGEMGQQRTIPSSDYGGTPGPPALAPRAPENGQGRASSGRRGGSGERGAGVPRTAARMGDGGTRGCGALTAAPGCPGSAGGRGAPGAGWCRCRCSWPRGWPRRASERSAFRGTWLRGGRRQGVVGPGGSRGARPGCPAPGEEEERPRQGGTLPGREAGAALGRRAGAQSRRRRPTGCPATPSSAGGRDLQADSRGGFRGKVPRAARFRLLTPPTVPPGQVRLRVSRSLARKRGVAPSAVSSGEARRSRPHFRGGFGAGVGAVPPGPRAAPGCPRGRHRTQGAPRLPWGLPAPPPLPPRLAALPAFLPSFLSF